MGNVTDSTGNTKGFRPSFTQGENTMEVDVGKYDLNRLESLNVSELLHVCKYYRDRVIRLGDADDVASLQRINDVLTRRIEIPVASDEPSSVPPKPRETRSIGSEIQVGIRESIASAVYPEISYRSKRSKVEVEPLVFVNKEEDTIIVSSEAASPLSLPPLLVKKRCQ